MAGKKALQEASARFRRAYPSLYNKCEMLIDVMGMHIRNTGAAEVVVGINEDGVYAREYK